MYGPGDAALRLGGMTPDERHREVLAQGTRIHPQYPREFERACSMAWRRIGYNQSCSANYTVSTRRSAYPALFQSDDVIRLAGERMSYLTGWQEGTVLAAQAVVAQFPRRLDRPGGGGLWLH